MENFLKESKQNLDSLNNFREIQIVLGNEACDLDSVISALVYGFLLYKLNGSSDVAVLPLLNIFQKDIKLKTEVTFFLEENDINLEYLCFRDQIDLKALHELKKLKLVLVDHNVLSLADSSLEDDVVEIIDHHKEGKEHYSEKCNRVIEFVGSCTTLIADKIINTYPSIMDPKIAMLLYGTILLDTVYLDDKAGRVTEKDKKVAEILKACLPDVNSRELFLSVQHAKNDISGLDIEDLLRRDIKIISSNIMNIAIASLPLLVEDLIKRSTITTELQKFGIANNFHVIVIMGIKLDERTNEVARQIAVFSCNDVFREQVSGVLLRSSELQLQQLGFEISGVSVFQQKNITASRKTVLPILNNFLLEGITTVNPLQASTKILIPDRASQKSSQCNSQDDLNDFDPFESSENIIITQLNGININQGPQLLGTGDPLSLTGSSQNSSNQNSCPYTPQNSYVDGDFENDYYAKQLLPSFNCRDMMEKIESKRGKLRDYEGDADTENYPFTPKNSFVEGNFDNYAQQFPSFDSDALIQKVNEISENRDTSEDKNKPSVQCTTKESLENNETLNPSSATGVDYKFNQSSQNEAATDKEGQSQSPDDNSLASSKDDKGDNLEDKMDISTSGSDKDIGSPATVPITHTDTKFSNRDNNSESCTRYKNSTSNLGLGPELDLDMATNYQAETVDFPDSPHQMKLLARHSMEVQGIHADAEVSQDDDEIFRTVLSPGSEDVVLKKVEGHFSEAALSSYDASSSIPDDSFYENEEYFEDSLILDDFFIRESSKSSDTYPSLSQSVESCSASVPKCDLQEGSRASTSLDQIDYSTVQKIISCFDQEKIKDIYNLSGRLQDLLTPIEIEEILKNSDVYAEYIDDEIFEALNNARADIPSMRSESLSSSLDFNGIFTNSTNKGKRTKIIPDSLSPLDDFVSENWSDVKITAVFEEGKEIDSEQLSLTPYCLNHQQKMLSIKKLKSQNIDAFFEESIDDGFSSSRKKIPVVIEADQSNDSFQDSETLYTLNDLSGSLSPDNLINDRLSLPLFQSDFDIEDFKNSSTPQRSNSVPVSLEIKNEKQDIKMSEKDSIETESSPSKTPERPNSLSKGGRKKKISVNPDILTSGIDDDAKSLSSLSNKSGDLLSPVDDLATPDDIDTPDELEDSVMERLGSGSEPIPELSAAEEFDEERSWRTCVIAGVQRKIDIKVIEPYKKVLSHGGYCTDTHFAIIVFSACYLPDHSRRDYDYVMDNLFLYVLTTLDQLVAEDYVLIYLHGATQRNNMPTFGWLKRCYQMIDRRLRKNLKGLYLVHPTFWLKTIVLMTKPFISSKFSRKLRFVNNLQELSELVPMDHVCIPDKVKQFDEERQYSLAQ